MKERNSMTADKREFFQMAASTALSNPFSSEHESVNFAGM
jgi:hypothetical protein